MLIYHQQLEELAKYRNQTDEPMVSLYLNVAPPEDYKSHLNSMIRTTRNELKDRLDKDRFEAVDRLFAAIEKHAKNTFHNLKNTRLVVIFPATRTTPSISPAAPKSFPSGGSGSLDSAGSGN